MILRAHPELAYWPAGVGELIWRAIIEQQSATRVDLAAACLMPDHAHLLLRPADQDLLTFVRTWKSYTARLAQQAGHRGSLWQPKMWDRSIRGTNDFKRTMTYIVMNPVEAGLVEDPDDYPWLLIADTEA